MKHVVKRFLTLGPDVESILKLRPALKSHFQEVDIEYPLALIIFSFMKKRKTRY